MRSDRLLLFPIHCTNYVTSLADPYMDIFCNSQVYILPAYSFRLLPENHTDDAWLHMYFHFLFYQIRIYKLFFRNSQIFCIFLQIFFWNTSAVHLTTVPTSATVIICKQLFMKFFELLVQFFFIRITFLECTEFNIFIFLFLRFKFYFSWCNHIITSFFSSFADIEPFLTQLCPVKFILYILTGCKIIILISFPSKLLLKFVSKACLSFIIFSLS